jgi:hypothetical protein
MGEPSWIHVAALHGGAHGAAGFAVVTTVAEPTVPEMGPQVRVIPREVERIHAPERERPHAGRVDDLGARLRPVQHRRRRGVPALTGDLVDLALRESSRAA